MQTVTVIAPVVELFRGRVKLNAKQAAVRTHALRAEKVEKDLSGVFVVVAPIQFKRGENFGFDGQIDKAMTEVLRPSAGLAAAVKA